MLLFDFRATISNTTTHRRSLWRPCRGGAFWHGARAFPCVPCVARSSSPPEGPSPSPPANSDAGLLSDYSKDGITEGFVKQSRIFLIRSGKKLYATSATCTHEGARLEPAKNGEGLFCPQHKSLFALDGKVQSGKAKRSLRRYGVSVNDKQHVIVDFAKTLRGWPLG